MQADTSKFVDNPKDVVPNTNIDNLLLQALQGAVQKKDLKDFYQVGVWNYCEGDITDGKETITYCSKRQNYFWFNPMDIWKLNNETAQKVFPDEMQKGLDAYHKVSRWMFTSFMIAVALTVGEILIGISAIFSRWGSFVTTIVSTVRPHPSPPASPAH